MKSYKFMIKGSDNVLVSVIIPTFQQTDKLYKAIMSVVNQSYQNIEVIIIDDNKETIFSDQVKKIVLSFENTPTPLSIRYYKNDSNRGSVYSRNRGINISTGEYISFLDDDDIYKHDKIQRQLITMIKNNSDFSVCNIALTSDYLSYTVRNRRFLNFDESLINKHYKYHITGTSTFMFKSKFLKNIGGFSESDFGDEFYLMEKAILKSERFSHLDYVGVIAYIDSASGLSSWKNKLLTENLLLSYKEKNICLLDDSINDYKYIIMRHYLVKANAYFNGRKYLTCFKFLLKSFVNSPFGFINILRRRDF